MSDSSSYWFVGASYSGTKDQTERFITEGIWENGYNDKYLGLVKSIKAGDHIAIKAAYTKKNGLPFDNRGHFVSVMLIKAIGVVVSNYNDGRKIKVDWTPLESPKEWYFYTNRSTIWRVTPGEWEPDGLISFTFNGKAQDIDRFRNAPFWRDRFGDKPTFKWTAFYEALADKLLDYRKDRKELVSAINLIMNELDTLSVPQDQYADGTTGPLKDICPFTTFALFNRHITIDNRRAIAQGLATFLGIQEDIPETFEAIPVMNNMKTWFFGYEKDREPDDIDKLWNIFYEAIILADSNALERESEFIAAYDKATKLSGVGWNLTIGLYWIRPWSYPALDSRSQNYIKSKLRLEIGKNGPQRRCNASDYLKFAIELEKHFEDELFPVNSFPKLSYEAWLYRSPKTTSKADDSVEEESTEETEDGDFIESIEAPIEPYSIDNIIEDGCFLERERLVTILERLRSKKNIILQGVPGTGKTWLAKRLALALITERDESKIKVVQFHPNLSYEDFIRGWRPGGEKGLSLVDGPFMEIVKSARKNPLEKYVIVIEEINRGNPAQIFGEMLTLLEADKRTPDEALELCYRRDENERVYIPSNLYLIGTMNIADRSLAMLDFALRRRFAFVDLLPCFNEAWHKWLNHKFKLKNEFIGKIKAQIDSLNDEITNDLNLGPQFQIGHSYLTPPEGLEISDPLLWFRNIVETDLSPLLREYWFDDLEKANNAIKRHFKEL